MLQPYLISPGNRVKRVEVTWDVNKGTGLVLKQARENMQSNLSQTLLVDDSGEEIQGKASFRTEIVTNTLFMVKNIIEKTVFQRKCLEISELRITMLQDILNSWYFLSLDYLKISKTPSKSLHSELLRTLSATQSPQNPSHSHHFSTFPTCDSEVSERKTGKGFRYSKEYRKGLEVEREVSKLIDGENRQIANVTYKAWRKRTDGDGKMKLVDRLYAQAINKQRQVVHHQSQSTLQALRQLRERIAHDSEEALYQAELEERISGKFNSVVSSGLAEFTRLRKHRRIKLERARTIRRQQDGVAKVFEDSVEKYTEMMTRVRWAKRTKASGS